MKDYFEWLGLFAVSGCLALLINSAAVAHQHAGVKNSHLVLTTEVKAAIATSATTLDQGR
jgi:hypothetical protein